MCKEQLQHSERETQSIIMIRKTWREWKEQKEIIVLETQQIPTRCTEIAFENGEYQPPIFTKLPALHPASILKYFMAR